jgi:hypothetical protein
MQVNIKGRDYEWKSDYDDGWVESAGDPYKYPVMIGGNNPCFIKRFERKQAPGTRLIELLRAKRLPGLARVYDIVQTEEADVHVRYLFCECMDGGTLDDLIKEGGAPDPARLLGDLIKAFGSMHGHEHWMSDFCEKNIFCKPDDAYCLIDLDSAHPVAKRPDNEIYGNKDYWSGGLAYLSQQAKMPNLRPGDVAGPVLNYLQLSLLIVRVKAGLVDKWKDYKSTELLDRIPVILGRTVPEFRALFKALVKNGAEVPSAEDIKRIKELLIDKVVNGALDYGEDAIEDDVDDDDDDNDDDVVVPVIRSFSSDKKRLPKGGPFTLSWEVEKGEKVVINRNGKKKQEVAKGQGALTLTERYDGKEKEVEFRLVVSNADAEVSSPLLIIHVGQRFRWFPRLPSEPAQIKMLLLKIAVGVVLVLVTLTVIEVVRHFSRPSPIVNVTAAAKDTIRVDTLHKLPPVDPLRHLEDSLNRRRDSIINTHKALEAANKTSDKPKPEPPKQGKLNAQPVIHDTVRVVSEAERLRQEQEAKDRAFRELKAEVQNKVREDSMRVVDTVIARAGFLGIHHGTKVLGMLNRSGFFLDTVVVEILPGGDAKPYQKKILNVKPKAFTVLVDRFPKEGVKASVVSVIF